MRTYLSIFGFLFLILPSFTSAMTLVNINTADAVLLDTLPGIGPSKATAIVTYRTEHGPFTYIEDIQKVSGIGPSTFADIKAFITVGDTGVSSTTDLSIQTSSTSPAQTSSGSAGAYVPPPSLITVHVGGNQNAIQEVPLHLSAQVTLKNGASDTSARIVWSFGDGSSGEGSQIEKTYRYAGTYLVVVTATDGSAIAHDDLSMSVTLAQVRIASLSGEGITLANDASGRLDLSNWRLQSGTGSFPIPLGTTLLPQTSVLFPYTITNLPISLDATLLYPNGIVAARYTPTLSLVTATTDVLETIVQPSVATTSYSKVQKVEPIISTNANVPAYEKKAVSAPVAASELAATGAAFASSSPESLSPVKKSAPSLLKSPWMLGLLGVITLAGSAFILL